MLFSTKQRKTKFFCKKANQSKSFSVESAVVFYAEAINYEILIAIK